MKALRYFRELAGLTQYELAEQAGVSQSSISNYERGLQIPIENLNALWGVLHPLVKGRVPGTLEPESLNDAWADF